MFSTYKMGNRLLKYCLYTPTTSSKQGFTVILNSLDFPGELHAFSEGSFAGFQDLVADGVLDAGQEHLRTFENI
jgi:hypothetical protein